MRRFEILRDGVKLGEGVDFTEQNRHARYTAPRWIGDTDALQFCGTPEDFVSWLEPGHVVRYLDPLAGCPKHTEEPDDYCNDCRPHGKLNIGPGEPRFDAGREWAYSKVREILEHNGQALVFDSRHDVVDVTRGTSSREPAGKIPSERIHELIRTGDEGVGPLSSFEALCTVLDERLGRG